MHLGNGLAYHAPMSPGHVDLGEGGSALSLQLDVWAPLMCQTAWLSRRRARFTGSSGHVLPSGQLQA